MDVPFRPRGSRMSSIVLRSCHLPWAVPLCPVALRDGRAPPVSGKLSAALFFSNFQVGGLGQ
jgi:hypothetical protein